GLGGIGTADDGVDVGNCGRLRDAAGSRLGKGIAMNFKTAAALLSYPLELGGNPVSGSVDSLTSRQVGFHAGERIAGAETNQRLNRLFYVGGVYGFQRTGDCRGSR